MIQFVRRKIAVKPVYFGTRLLHGQQSLRVCIAVVLFALLFQTEFSLAADAERKVVIKDLDYGEALYYFYQKKYFQTGVRLLLAQEQDRIPNHEKEADLLLGGLYLSYGMHREAETHFLKMADQDVNQDVRDKAWFTLGKIRYQKGLHDDAIRALEQLNTEFSEKYKNTTQLLMANLLMARGDYLEAAEHLKQLPSDAVDAAYARYNLGIALLKGGKQVKGAEFLADVGRIQRGNDEVLALRDKANLALGFALLTQNETKKANQFFQRVRIRGPFSNKALLGLGWTYMLEEDYEAALSPWLELRGRPRNDSAVYESLLAVAHALEKLEAYPQSMQSYQEAMEIFSEEITKVSAAIKEIRDGRLINTLVLQAMLDKKAKFEEDYMLVDLPETRFISNIVSTHEFHEAIKNLRDLKLLKDNLQKWSDSVPAYRHMLELRRKAYEERVPMLLPEKGVYKLANFKDELTLYKEEYNRIVKQGDYKALANDKEAKLINKLDDINLRLRKLTRRVDPKKETEFKEKYRLLRGLLEWDIVTTSSQRLWDLKKGIIQLQREIDKTAKQQKLINQSKKRAPSGFRGFKSQINDMDKKIKSLNRSIDKAYAEQRELLEEKIVTQFISLKEKLSEYMDQATFSVARLQDIASGQQPEKK